MSGYIKLRDVYRGRRTREQPINPGVYSDNDPKLLGVPANYLVTNRHAVWVDPPEGLPSLAIVSEAATDEAPVQEVKAEEIPAPEHNPETVEPEGADPKLFEYPRKRGKVHGRKG